MNLKAFILALIISGSALAASPLKIDSSFPGGSIKIEKIDQEARLIAFAPAAHRDRGWDCWWYFKVEGIEPGETLTIDLLGTGFASPKRACFSLDRKEWKQTEPGKREKQRIVYRQKIDAKEAWFAWGPPLTLQDARDWIDRVVKSSPHAKAFELCRSKDDRPVPGLRIEQAGADAKDRLGIWVNARQHAWESGGSWVGKGLVDWLVSDDPRAEALRKKATIHYVPIMDVDNVEIGAGGKNQKPHDHNRDWSAEPVFPAVKAAQARIKEMNDAGCFDLFIDLHNPGPNETQPYFFVPIDDVLPPKTRGNQTMFVDAAKLEMTGPLKLAANTKTTGPAYDKEWEKISAVWVVKNTKPQAVGICLETAWDTPNSLPPGYERVGKELGLAVERYFRESRR